MFKEQTSPLDTVTDPVAVSSYQYCVYGVTLQSGIPLALSTDGSGELAQIELRTAPASYFSDAQRELPAEQDSGSWFKFVRLRDHSSYVRWEGLGEFLVSARGHLITARQFDAANPESFQVYLLGQALSFALVKCGFEPLHATTVVVNGEAVVFLGESGFGKSSLAACFLEAGCRMLTDDLLVLKKLAGGFLAYPGPPRIKLFPKLARRFLGNVSNGVAMNSETKKLIFPLGTIRRCEIPTPLKAVYTLASPREVFRKQPVRIETLSPRSSFLELVKNTFNYRVVNSDRLERQFNETAGVVSVAPVKKISYPRVLNHLPAVRDAILADLNSPKNEQASWGN
jgi:hypothetical protein